MNIGCSEVPKPSYLHLLWPAEWKVPAPLSRARSSRARRACALRTLGLLLADGAPKLGWGKTFWRVGRVFFLRKRPFLGNIKLKNRSEGAKSTILPRATNGPKSKFLGPKKRVLLSSIQVLVTTVQSCAKKKGTLFPNECQYFSRFWVFF